MKILVVDDEKFNLEIANQIISASISSENVILCNSPTQVIGILRQDQIDVIILDIVMPELNGLDLLKIIRQNDEWRDIQILMFTSLTDKNYIKKCFESGADDYINKPIEEIEFVARLKAALNKRQYFQTTKCMYEQMCKQNRELRDLTQQLKATQLHMIQKETLASLGELAAGIAHEINNPIGYVGSNIATLGKYLTRIKEVMEQYRIFVSKIDKENYPIEDLLVEKERIEQLEKVQKINYIMGELDEIIKDCQEGIGRVTKIVQTFRNYARTGTEEELVYNDLNHIVEETTLMVRNEAKYSINISQQFGFIPQVACNKAKIGQVILNMLLNAIQAIKSQNREERGNIVIRTYSDHKYVCCQVIDDGPGIKAEHLNRVFDPFFTTKDVGKGTGLGLSISHDIIVNQHKGDFLVESQEGEGATFTFCLPINQTNF